MMQRKDLAIGLVGTLILLAAMVGVFRFEAAQAGDAYRVSWPTATAAGPGDEGRSTEGQETAVDLNFTSVNITRIEFVLSWEDDVAESEPDTFTLRVVAPNGTAYEAEAASGGELVIDAAGLALVPQEIRVNGASKERVERDLVTRYANDAATGIWQVTVTMVEAGGTSGPAGGLPLPQDDGNDWTLTTRVTTYSADAKSV